MILPVCTTAICKNVLKEFNAKKEQFPRRIWFGLEIYLIRLTCAVCSQKGSWVRHQQAKTEANACHLHPFLSCWHGGTKNTCKISCNPQMASNALSVHIVQLLFKHWQKYQSLQVTKFIHFHLDEKDITF